MRRRIALYVMLACAFPLVVFAQAAPKAAQKTQSELPKFKAFIEQHPRALEELKKDPSLIEKPEFAKSHRVVGQYLAAHPNVKKEVMANPKFFDGITAKKPVKPKRPGR